MRPIRSALAAVALALSLAAGARATPIVVNPQSFPPPTSSQGSLVLTPGNDPITPPPAGSVWANTTVFRGYLAGQWWQFAGVSGVPTPGGCAVWQTQYQLGGSGGGGCVTLGASNIFTARNQMPELNLPCGAAPGSPQAGDIACISGVVEQFTGSAWAAIGSGTPAAAGGINPALATSAPPAPPTNSFPYPLVNVAGMSTGAVSANSIDPAHWTNPADTVVAASSWTPTPQNYLYANTAANFVLRSLYASRDVDVNTWTANGTVYERLTSDGNAIYFTHNIAQGTGYLEVGFAFGVTNTGVAKKYPIYENSALTGFLAGYSQTNSSGASFDFGLYGNYAYVIWSGGGATGKLCPPEIVAQICIPLPQAVLGPARGRSFMRAGAVAMTSVSNDGFRATTLTHLPQKKLFGDYDNNEIDVRDYGVRSTPPVVELSATAGASFVVGGISNGSGGAGTAMTINSISSGMLCPGDRILDLNGKSNYLTPSGFAWRTTIVSTPAGSSSPAGCTAATGAGYTVSASQLITVATAALSVSPQVDVTAISYGSMHTPMLLRLRNRVGGAATPTLKPGSMVMSQETGAAGGVGFYLSSASDGMYMGGGTGLDGYFGVTTGTMTSGSPTLTVASQVGYAPGDELIVQCGGEAGGCAPGTKGIGGTWPPLQYNSVSTMNADTSQATNTFACPLSGGASAAYQWNGSAWAAVNQAVYGYYDAYCLPQSLQAQATAFPTATTVTLNQNAQTSTTNAAVWLDNGPMLNFLLGSQTASVYPVDLTPITPTGVKVRFPAGLITVGGDVVVNTHAGLQILGETRQGTVLYSPHAMRSASLIVTSSPECRVSDLTIMGNQGQNTNWGLAVFAAYNNQPTSFLPNGYNADGSLATTFASNVLALPAVGSIPSGLALPYGINIAQNSDDCVTENNTVNNVLNEAIAAHSVRHPVFRNDTIHLQTNVQSYTQWQFDCVNTIDCSVQDLVVDADWMVAAVEAFGSYNTEFQGIKITNGSISLNADIGLMLRDCAINITGQLSPSYSNNNDLIEADNNSGPASDIHIHSCKMQQFGPVDANNDVLRGVLIAGSITHDISDIVNIAPNWASPSTTAGPVAVTDQGIGNIDGIVATGTPMAGHYNVEAYNPFTGHVTRVSGTVKPLTFATLPANPGTGDTASITDAMSCTPYAPVAGGNVSYAYCKVTFDGTNWVGD